MLSIEAIRRAIIADPANQAYTEKGIYPLFQAAPNAKILIVGQAPGWKAQEKGRLFADPSGDHLRAWLGIEPATFYDANQIAILPMDFYYLGKGKSGDLPPRKDFAAKWHPQILANLPKLELIILLGQYAQGYYLKDKKKRTLTETVRAYEEYLYQRKIKNGQEDVVEDRTGVHQDQLTKSPLDFQRVLPRYLPLVHPSPRNNIWQARNPIFKEEIVPVLQTMVRNILSKRENSYN